jgi:hypothetical protein
MISNEAYECIWGNNCLVLPQTHSYRDLTIDQIKNWVDSNRIVDTEYYCERTVSMSGDKCTI